MRNQYLKGKVVAITGASSGIGEQTAYKAAELGASVVLLARSEDKLAAAASRIERTTGLRPLYFGLDVSDPGQVERVFTTIYKQAGRIDILVNNAGFGIFEEFEKVPLDEVKKMFDVNVFGVIACTGMVLPHMKEQKSGHIINVASQAGKLATPKSSAYSATKHAVLGLTNSLRMEAAPYGIHVTAVNPGPIKTNFFETADKSGSYVKSVEKFMLPVDAVAEKITGAMVKPRREINLPRWMNAGSVLYQLFPGLVEKVAGDAFRKK